MKTTFASFTAVIFLASLWTGFGQPVITNEPESQFTCVGTEASFTVGATGAQPLAYHWQKTPDGVNYSDPPACTNATLVITNVQLVDGVYYRVVITNLEGAVTSVLARLNVVLPASISLSGQPTNWTPVSLGATVGNRVTASSTVAPGYQWRRDGVSLPGQTQHSLILTNVQMADVGRYDVVVSNMCGSVISSNVSLVVDPTFTKITSGAIVTDQASFGYGGWGACWGDYDNDGFPDLIVPAGTAQAAIWQRSALYHNQGGTNFLRVGGVVETPMPYCNQALWADLNNDGCLDLLETGNTPDWVTVSNRLFLGRTDHGFDLVTNDVTPNPQGVGGCCLAVDYDNDGAVDLFHLIEYPTLGYTTHATLRRNRGDANFENVWTTYGPLIENRYGVWGDFDNDGDRDLWHLGAELSGAHAPGQFYRNNGDGTFELLETLLPVVSGYGFAGDYDYDGRLDLLNSNRLRHNDFGTNFPEVWTPPITGWGRLGDYDNDGDLDIVSGLWRPCQFYRNDGLAADGRTPVFTAVDLGSPSHDMPTWITVPVWCDYNNDGFLDLFVTTSGDPAGPNLLYRNSGLAAGNTNRWLIVKPKGIASNYSAIGVKVRVKATIRGNVTWQMREIAGSYYDDLRAHFGLGNATNIDVVQVEWTSGITQTLASVTVNQILSVVEHQEYGGPSPALANAAHTPEGLRLSIVEPAATAVYALQASTDLVNWTKLMARKSAGGTFAYTDTCSANYPRRFYRVVVP